MTLNIREILITAGVFVSAALLFVYLRFLVNPIDVSYPLSEYSFLIDLTRMLGAPVAAGFIVGFLLAKRVWSGILLGCFCVLFTEYVLQLVMAFSYSIEFSIITHLIPLGISGLGALGGGFGTHLRNTYKIDLTQIRK